MVRNEDGEARGTRARRALDARLGSGDLAHSPEGAAAGLSRASMHFALCASRPSVPGFRVWLAARA